MALTKADTIEIQEAAKFNHMRRLREQEEKKEFQEMVAKKIAEATGKVQAEESVQKKGK